MKSYTAYEANPMILDTIKNKINDLLEKGRVHYNNIGESGVKEVGRNSYIEETEEKKFDALSLFYSLLSYKDQRKADTFYEFPGMKVDGHSVRLVLPIEKASEVADKAEYLETELSAYGVKFPAQLYQLRSKYKGQNIPGKTYPAPLPKTLDMTDNEYEAYLESYYKAHGDSKTSDGVAFRKPYLHETVNYKKDNAVETGFVNEYYQDQVALRASGKGKTKAAPVGQKLRVAVKSLKNPTLGVNKDKVETEINWKKIKSNAIKIAAVSAGVAGAAILLNSNPIALIGLASVGGISALAHYIKKKINEKKIKAAIDKEEADKKAKEAEEEAEKERQKQKQKQQGKGKGQPQPTHVPTPGPVPGPTPVPTPGPTKTGSRKKPSGGANPTPVPTVPPVTPVGGNNGNSSNPTPTPVTKSDPDDIFAYDPALLATAEEDLSLDNLDFNRINSELTVLRAKIFQMESTASTDEEKQALHDLKVDEVRLMRDRLAIAKRLAEKQELLLANLEASGKSK